MKNRRHDPEMIRQLLAQRDAEGLTFVQLAERSGVPIHVLHHRAHTDARAAKVSQVEGSAFVEVCADVPRAASGVEILLAQGLRIQLRQGFDQATLSRLLSTVAC